MADHLAAVRPLRTFADPSGKRAVAVSRGQITKRWASELDLALCLLCWFVVERGRSDNGRLLHRFHSLCWDTWRSTPAYRQAWRWRRWQAADDSRPIDPPIPPWLGRPPQSQFIRKKYVWFLRRYVDGVEVTTLAEDSEVTQPAVTTGIRDFTRWLPGDWAFVFRNPRKVELLESRFPLRGRVVPDREPRVKWLHRYGMAPERIAWLVGYPENDVRAILELPRVPTRRVAREPIRVGAIVIDLDAKQVTVNDAPVRLSRREYGLLEALALAAGDVVTLDELARRAQTTSGAVKVHIGHLRRKLDGAGEPVKTLAGTGYALACPKGGVRGFMA